MTSGDVVTVRLRDDRSVDLVLDDKVFPDRTCGQHDEGFWAYDGADDTREFFVSTYDGAVYRMPENQYVGDIVSVSTLKEDIGLADTASSKPEPGVRLVDGEPRYSADWL